MPNAALAEGAAGAARWPRVVVAQLLLLLLAFWPTVLTFPGTWSRSYQEQGFFAAALVAWLIWRDRRLLADGYGRGLPWLLPLIAAASVAWLLAVVINVQVVHQTLFVLVITGWGLSAFGGGARARLIGFAATFLLGVPFWSVLIPGLQRLTVMASGVATRMAGIDAEVGYDYIRISSGTFLVESGCSGINFLMAALVLGAYYAHLFVDRWQSQLKIVTAAGAFAILGNWIRVSTLIFLGEATAMRSPYIEDHLLQGWLIFILLMVPAYFTARWIERRDGTSPPRTVPTAREDAGGTTVSGSGSASRSLGRATAAAALGPLLFLGIGSIPRSGELDRELSAVGVRDTWSASPISADELDWRPAFRGIDDVAAWVLSSSSGSIEAARYYFADQRQGEELIQYDNVLAPDSLMVSTRQVGPVGTGDRVVNEAIVRSGGSARLVWYWYRVAGVETRSSTGAKLLEIAGFFTRHPASELVTLSTECEPGDCTAAAERLWDAVGPPEPS